MRHLVSWPMYAVDPIAVGAFWTHLRAALVDAGIPDVPVVLSDPDDLLAHWRDPDLVLSQTCGFPYVTSLKGRIRYVATPCFAVPGCEGALYSSAVVVRQDEPAQSIDAMAGRRVAFNSRDSQSGYNSLRALVAPLATEGRFFMGALETGAHRRSLQAVASGAADLAAIDVVTLDLVTRHAPAEVRGLRVLCHTALVPGLPLITARGASDKEVRQLRGVVQAACRSEVARRTMRITEAEVLPETAYEIILAQRDAALTAGYPDLA